MKINIFFMATYSSFTGMDLNLFNYLPVDG